jgi:hypothetical protein
MTSTIYASVVSCKVIKACVVHSRGCFSAKSSVTMAELTTSRCSISRTVQTNALVDHGCFPLRAAILWSRRSQRTPAVCCTVS